VFWDVGLERSVSFMEVAKLLEKVGVIREALELLVARGWTA
jgi:hypothetical protein